MEVALVQGVVQFREVRERRAQLAEPWRSARRREGRQLSWGLKVWSCPGPGIEVQLLDPQARP